MPDAVFVAMSVSGKKVLEMGTVSVAMGHSVLSTAKENTTAEALIYLNTFNMVG